MSLLYSLFRKNFQIKKLIEKKSCDGTRLFLISRDKKFSSKKEN